MGVKLRSLVVVAVLLLVILSLRVFSVNGKTKELNSPGDWIKQEQIKIYGDKIVLEIQNPLWATFTDTNSMDPFIDEKAHAIEVSPEKADAINVGDVISYQTKEGIIIHRVIEKRIDEEGVYYVVKGDNSSVSDPNKIRFEEVQGVVVAVIY